MAAANAPLAGAGAGVGRGAGGGRLRLRPWAPEYDGPGGGERPDASADVDVDGEVPASRWAPRRPVVAPERTVVFVDGVQRVDAFGELDDGDAVPMAMLFASVAAGAVRTGGDGERGGGSAGAGGLFAAGGPAGAVLVEPVLARVACAAADPGAVPPYAWRRCGPGAAALMEAVAGARHELEVGVAAAVATGDDLVVVDGPLRGHEHLRGTVGYVKRHEVSYLEPALEAVVAALAPGERTPLFALATRWNRWSWYARLPGASGLAWDAVVRGEAPAVLGLAEAAALADRATASLPAFASSPVKDPRAPQNLVPIGGLERLLRHRLGERELLERLLRRALG
ncbi:MAG: hypothetical protein GEV08_23555 [Acidimicrobiia bacterium]|nr:hypothetical protein [Acidimicrobiia bacterium]